MSRVSEETIFQRRYADGQQIHEKMLNITINQGNANQNHSEKSPHICQNGYYIKKKYFPGGPVAKKVFSQCRRPRFDPWSGN